MQYKIEALYTYGWDDAGWSEENDGATKPLRFQSIECAQTELDEFLADVKEAVATGYMDTEADRNDYRIVVVN